MTVNGDEAERFLNTCVMQRFDNPAFCEAAFGGPLQGDENEVAMLSAIGFCFIDGNGLPLAPINRAD